MSATGVNEGVSASVDGEAIAFGTVSMGPTDFEPRVPDTAGGWHEWIWC